MANLIRFDPFAEMRALQKQFFNDDWFTALPNMHLPTTDVYIRDDKEMVVEAHLPHFKQADVTVDVDNGMLEIQAGRHEQEADKSKRYMVRESTNSFYRRLRLPENADAKHVKAHMDDGILRVAVPLKKHSEPLKVTIDSNTSKRNDKQKK